MASLTIYTGKEKPFIFKGTKKQCEYVEWLYISGVWHTKPTDTSKRKAYEHLLEIGLLEVNGDWFKMKLF